MTWESAGPLVDFQGSFHVKINGETGRRRLVDRVDRERRSTKEQTREESGDTKAVKRAP